MTTLLIAPVRDAALLAKQAASIDVLTEGRLTLGLGVGRREDDYAAVHGRFDRRGHRFEQQLALMKRVWAGESPVDGATWAETGDSGLICLAGKRLPHDGGAIECIGWQLTGSGRRTIV